MNEQLKEYKISIGKLSINEQKMRDLYLRKLALGEIQGPLTGYASIDKPWLKYYDEDAILTELPKQTIYEHIYERNKNNLNAIALNYFKNKITYKELFKNIDAIAASFTEIGIKKGDVVSFCMPTTPETIYSIYALNKIGAITNLIDLSTNNTEISNRIKNTGSKHLIMLDSLYDKLKDTIEDLDLNLVISVSPQNSIPKIAKIILKLKQRPQKIKSEKYIDWNEFKKLGRKRTPIRNVEYEENMPAIIVYTGGTTGKSKGAVLSNDGINATIMQLKATGIKSKTGDKYLDIMPPFIAYGVVCGIHNPLSERQEIIIIPKLEPEKFAKYIKTYKPNHVIGVPALFETMTQSKEIEETNLEFLNNLICGGDKLTVTSEEKINNFLKEHKSSAKVAQGFGMTEVGTSVTYTINNSNYPSENHIGCPLVLTNIMIINPETEEELRYKEEGEICIKTPSRMLGYFNNEQETKKVVRIHKDGSTWIHSQDIGYFDKEGELYFKDRIKRMIVRHDGHNVWPGVIEQLILTHYAVESCIVVGIKTDTNSNGAIPTAVIVLKEEYKNEAKKIIEEIDKMCKGKMPLRDIAQEYILSDSLPKTPVGKIDFKKVEEDCKNKEKILKR